MKYSNLIGITGICIFTTMAWYSSYADSVLDGIDPCVKEENQFKSEENRIRGAFDSERKRLEEMPIPKNEYKKIWDQVAYQSARKQIIERYSGISFTEEQLGQMGQKEVDNYIKTVGEDGVQKEMLTIFEEHKKQSLVELDNERALSEVELSKQRDELKDACGNGEGERILRVIISGIDQRIKSMDSESSIDAKALKFTTGISLADINKYGLLGGPNSEARKVAQGIENIVAANIEAAKREKGDINKAIRATTGISVEDIKKHGILGGENSEARKLFKALGF